jgi:hypothetical protein
MRYLALVVIVIALAASAVFAQSAAEPPVCDGAQEYYDSLKAGDDIDAIVLEAITGRTTSRVNSIEEIKAYADELLTGDFPTCAARAVGLYSTGLTVLSMALEDYLDEDTLNGSRQNLLAVQYIGEWRGYMRAIGVEVETAGRTATFK